jgi:Rod binding domain-containing protein
MIPAIFAGAVRMEKASPELAKLHKATNAFETQFVKQLVTEMRKSDKSEFGDMPGSGIYDDIANQVLAEKLSAKGGFGISDSMFKQLSKLVLAQQDQAQSVKKP